MTRALTCRLMVAIGFRDPQVGDAENAIKAWSQQLADGMYAYTVDGNQSCEFGPHAANRPMFYPVSCRGARPVAREASCPLRAPDPRCQGISACQALEFLVLTAIPAGETHVVRGPQWCAWPMLTRLVAVHLADTKSVHTRLAHSRGSFCVFRCGILSTAAVTAGS